MGVALAGGDSGSGVSTLKLQPPSQAAAMAKNSAGDILPKNFIGVLSPENI
jgi:hypothetical protein